VQTNKEHLLLFCIRAPSPHFDLLRVPLHLGHSEEA